jgi:hypothetical protein
MLAKPGPFGRAVVDQHGLAASLYGHLLPQLDVREVQVDRGDGADVG